MLCTISRHLCTPFRLARCGARCVVPLVLLAAAGSLAAYVPGIGFAAYGSVSLDAEDVPYLGNATRNSWADQHSIVIWTRTTARPQMQVDGKPFLRVTDQRARELARISDVSILHGEQIPEGLQLADMLGSCPGRAGKVRLTWFPVETPNRRSRTAWVTTTAEKDFTAQWRLTELLPGTVYRTFVETRTLDVR
ncbi:MAG: hypothetical protein ACO3FE_19530, partial [Planctomycetaceae bacterium]